jgi:hypothetical protein
LFFSRADLMKQSCAGTWNGLARAPENVDPKRREQPAAFVSTLPNKPDAPANFVSGSFEAAVVARPDPPPGDDGAEREAKRTKHLPPGSTLGYHPGMISTMYSTAVRPSLNSAVPPFYQPGPSHPPHHQWSFSTTLPAPELSPVPTAPEAAGSLAAAPHSPRPSPDTAAAAAAAAKAVFDRAEAAALLLGIRDSPPASPQDQAEGRAATSTGIDAAITGGAISWATHSGAALRAFPPPPRQLGQLVDTRVTTVEGLYWSWLLSGPGLGPPGARAQGQPPLPSLLSVGHQSRPSVLPWPSFVLGEPPAAQNWIFS